MHVSLVLRGVLREFCPLEGKKARQIFVSAAGKFSTLAKACVESVAEDFGEFLGC